MSSWTYINGLITVCPMGRTQPEKRYILETVLEHLPKVSGGEGGMMVQILQKPGHNMSSTHDEFLQYSNLGNGKFGMFEMQGEYFLVVNASLRRREFNQTFREFMNWLCRLSKRIVVDSALVRIDGWKKSVVINANDDNNPFEKMHVDPSWSDENSENWCEYLMWDEGE